MIFYRGIEMTGEAKAKTPVLAKIASDKVLCYISMALFIVLPVAEIINEVLKRLKIKAFRTWYPSFLQPYVVAVFGIALTLFVILSLIGRAVSGKFKFYVADVFYFTLLAFMLISMFCSKNFGVFADGHKHYMEHPLHFLCYYGLFYAGSMIEDTKLRKKVLITYVIVAVIQGVVAFLQTRGFEISYCLFEADRPGYTATYGLLQNTNFFGTLSCVLTAVTSGLFIMSSKIFKNKAAKWAIFALSILMFYVMIASMARLAWLGLGAMILTYIISFAIMSKKGAIDKDSLRLIIIDFITIIIGYIVVIILNIILDSSITDKIEQTTEDLSEISDSGNINIGNGRDDIWRAALSSVPHHWATGIGLDNLAEAFREQPGWQPGMYVQSKGHCEYIHTLATQGVFAIINYLALLIYAAVSSVKAIINEKDDVKRSYMWIFFGAFVAYISQALVSSSVMNVAPYFWLILGLVTARTKPISLKKK